jgi:hypothetical protein
MHLCTTHPMLETVPHECLSTPESAHRLFLITYSTVTEQLLFVGANKASAPAAMRCNKPAMCDHNARGWISNVVGKRKMCADVDRSSSLGPHTVV